MPDNIDSIPVVNPPIRFFTYSKSKWSYNQVLIISYPNVGIILKANGEGLNSYQNSMYSQARCLEKLHRFPASRRWIEIDWKQAIKLINIGARKMVAGKIGLTLPPPMVISEELKDKVIKNLTKRRARNADSSYFCMKKDLELYEAMAENGLIKTLCGKSFYIVNK